MNKRLKLFATTCIVGFGALWGFLIISTLHGLLSESSSETLYLSLFYAAIVLGIAAAAVWFFRRLRDRPVIVLERALFGFSALSAAYLCYFLVSGEVNDFLAFDPLVAAQRVADKNGTHGDSFSFLGTTNMGVRVYAIQKDGEARCIIGVAPRCGMWWRPAFNMNGEDYERHNIGKPLQ